MIKFEAFLERYGGVNEMTQHEVFLTTYELRSAFAIPINDFC